MKFFSALSLLGASAFAALEARQRPVLSRYELSLAAPFDAPFHDGAVSLKDNTAGFYADQTDPLIINVKDGVSQDVQLATGDGGFLSLAGESGLQDLVLIGEDGAEGGSGFTIELREGEERLYNVTWGGDGQWLAQNVGEDDYELKWWDGEGVTVATVFPVQLVGRLTGQS